MEVHFDFDENKDAYICENIYKKKVYLLIKLNI